MQFHISLIGDFRLKIDTLNDAHNRFVFEVNPYNSQYKRLFANGGSYNESTELDSKWFSDF
jgi:hypothetical protein